MQWYDSLAPKLILGYILWHIIAPSFHYYQNKSILTTNKFMTGITKQLTCSLAFRRVNCRNIN